MRLFKSWDKFDDKMRDRAKEELLRFMTLFSTTAGLIAFAGMLVSGGDMLIPFILLTFMLIFFIGWQYTKRKNEKTWGVARRTGKEILHIGKPRTAEEIRRQEKATEKFVAKAQKRADQEAAQKQAAQPAADQNNRKKNKKKKNKKH